MFLFSCRTQQFSVRSAVPADVDRLAQLYRAVEITAERCHRALNAADGSFTKRGGMFEISREEDLRRILNDKNEKILVAEYDATVYGLLWFGLAETDTFADLTPLPEQKDAAARMAKARADGLCGYAKEIISLGPDIPREIPLALFYAMMSEYIKTGVALTIGEVYAIDKYRINDETFESGLLNLASRNFLLKSGGVELGRTKQKQVNLENYSIWKTPHIFLWNTFEAVRIIRQELANKGWEIDQNENKE